MISSKFFGVFNYTRLLFAFILFLGISIETQAQKVRAFLLYGTTLSSGDTEDETAFIDSGDYLTGGLLFSVSRKISVGPTILAHHSLRPVFDGGANGGKADAAKSSSSRIGLMSRIHLIDRRKFEMYVTGVLGYLSLKYSGYDGTLAYIDNDASLKGSYLSVNTGLVYKISPGIHLNIIDFGLSGSSLGEPFNKLNLYDLSTGIIFRSAKDK